MENPGKTFLGLQPSFMGTNENRKLSGSVTESVSIIIRDMSDDGTEGPVDSEGGNKHKKNRRISHFNIDPEGKTQVKLFLSRSCN